MLTIAPTYAGKVSIPSPEVTSLMLESLQIQPSDKVLEIGTGSGYQTWRLTASGAKVFSIELKPQFLPVDPTQGISFRVGDGSKGLPEEAPFNVIMATCGVKSIPNAWVEQTIEGGRILAPIGDPEVQRLTLYQMVGFGINPIQVLAYVRFLMMEPDKETKPMKPIYKEQYASSQ